MQGIEQMRLLKWRIDSAIESPHSPHSDATELLRSLDSHREMSIAERGGCTRGNH